MELEIELSSNFAFLIRIEITISELELNYCAGEGYINVLMFHWLL